MAEVLEARGLAGSGRAECVADTQAVPAGMGMALPSSEGMNGWLVGVKLAGRVGSGGEVDAPTVHKQSAGGLIGYGGAHPMLDSLDAITTVSTSSSSRKSIRLKLRTSQRSCEKVTDE